ncbi:hypothetical protein [Sphingobacterium sp. IITKGP-BTPF85]|uniref:hypothetical protein n=1 Tax=Sphingobacterium sp. IITKGP-BTPF85 TaxID=1338009 RepID=UPI000389EFF9|nr:hypothetical protein [Sphingobacterium sp. IITKGP-BTPF85]KKX48346.1 hypothetical protein L950_0221580 [Sphingobacterium sp. IITKGP-BTPF85]
MIEGEGAIEANNRYIKQQFYKKWGFFELLHQVCEYLFISMLEGMKESAVNIFVYASLLKDKVNVLKK